MLSYQAIAIAVASKETMQTELSSKVRDLCQVCNWARTVTKVKEDLDKLIDIQLAFNKRVE